MVTWEFPPLITGGLALACYGMVKELLKKGIEIDLILPTRDLVYFPLRKVEDADDPPVKFLENVEKKEREVNRISEVIKKFEVLGLVPSPEAYLSPAGVMREMLKELEEKVSLKKFFEVLSWSLERGEDLFRKVYEMAGRMPLYAEKLSFDLVHVHDWLTYPAGVVLKEITRKPLIAHIHATEFDRAGGSGDGRIHEIEYTGLSSADLVIAVSEFTARMIADRYLVPFSKIRVVHNAHSIEFPGGKRRIFVDPVILFLGRITLQKGPDYFLKVSERILKDFPEVHFVVAGTGDMFRKIVHLSAGMKLRTGVLFTGFLERKKVEKLLEAADILIMPSVSEPFGIVPLEAMAYGVVPIISKKSGVAEIVNNAYKVEFWDIDRMVEIVRFLLSDRKKLEDLAYKMKEEAMGIQWSRAAGKLINIYQELV